MQLTLLSLSEEDQRYHNVSVLNFVVERQTESLCEQVCAVMPSASMNITSVASILSVTILFQVKTDCTEDKLCAKMSCNMSSIAQSCLHLALPANQVDGIWDEDEHQDRENRDLLPLWLGEILSNGYPDGSVSATLKSVVEYYTFVNCVIPEDGSDEQIKCVDY